MSLYNSMSCDGQRQLSATSKSDFVFCMISVYAYNVACCSRPWKLLPVCSLLLRNKYTEIVLNSSVSRPRDNANIYVVNYGHCRTAVVRWG